MSLYKILNEINNLKYKTNNELYNKLIVLYPNNINSINLFMYDKYKYIYIEENSELKDKRTGQELFKTKLIDRYKVCIITKSSPIICQACHIIPYSECNNEDKYNINNGLLMSCDFHVLFDKKYFIINPITLQCIFTEDILQDYTMIQYTKYHGIKLNISSGSIPYLQKLYESIIM